MPLFINNMSDFEKKLKRLLDADNGKTRYPKKARLAKTKKAANRVEKRQTKVVKGERDVSPDANKCSESKSVCKHVAS